MLNLMVSPDATGLSSAQPATFRANVNQRRKADFTERLVIFRADAVDGRERITAVFPCEAAFGGEMAGYSKEEGHVSISRLWFDMSRPAKDWQYADLAIHLRDKGYWLDVRHRLTPAMETTRARMGMALTAASEKAQSNRNTPSRTVYAVPEGIDLKRPVIHPDGSEGLYYTRDAFGVLRGCEGIPQTLPGTVTPLGYVELGRDTPAMMAGFQVACGLAAASWAKVSGPATEGGREVVLCLVEEACDTFPDHITETFALAPHELDTARDRVARRLASDLVFAKQFSQARAMMDAGCAFFPWSRGDGRIPG